MSLLTLDNSVKNMKGKTEKTISAYDNSAVAYTEKFSNYEPYIQQILDFSARYIPSSAHILDIACGPGDTIHLLQKVNESCSYTGIDLSEKFLQLARSKNPEAEFIRQDIRTLSLKKTFNNILASFCIVHLHKKELPDFIRRLALHLEPEGYLYLSFMEGDSAGFETTSFSLEEIFFTYYTVDYVVSVLRENGIDVEEISRQDYEEQDGSVTSDIFIFAKKR